MVEYDVFPIGGQSNAEGRGDSSLSPDVGAGNAFEYTSNELVQLDDPVGDAETGSAWPAFAVEYFSRTGRESVFQEDATGASRMTEAEAGNGNNGVWDPDSNDLYDAMITDINEMLTYINNQGDDPTIRGILWWQGESDAQNIDGGAITKADYKDATEQMIDAFRTDLSLPDLNFFIIQIGYDNPDGGTGDTQGYQDVRAAQEEIAQENENTYLMSDRAKEMIDEGRVSPSNGGTHPDQSGLDIIGTQSAINVTATTDGSRFLAKRGTTTDNDGYTGSIGEPTIDTDTYQLVGHDGTTTGGTRYQQL